MASCNGAPVSLLEAYALGKPVIGARIGGIPELIREGETGTTFASADVASLRDALSEMTSRSDDQVARMGRSGREWVEREFTAEKYRSRLLAAYRDVGAAVPDSADGVLRVTAPATRCKA
jgi:glycosyltransferase involved in cell wall biosynthesis